MTLIAVWNLTNMLFGNILSAIGLAGSLANSGTQQSTYLAPIEKPKVDFSILVIVGIVIILVIVGIKFMK